MIWKIKYILEAGFHLCLYNKDVASRISDDKVFHNWLLLYENLP